MNREGNSLFVATSYKHLFYLDLGRDFPLKEWDRYFWYVSFTPDDRHLLVGGTGAVALAGLDGLPFFAIVIPPSPGRRDEVWRPIQSPSRRYIAASCSDRGESILLELTGSQP